MLYVPLVLVSGGKRKEYTAQNKTLCKALCVRMYFECYEKYECAKPEMTHYVGFCKTEYKKCFPKCLDELYVLDLYPSPDHMSEENKKIFFKLKEELGDIKPVPRF